MASSSTSVRAGSGFAAAFLALVLGAVAMGISPIFVRYANADVGPFASAFWRVFLALPILYAWMRIEEARQPRAAAVPVTNSDLPPSGRGQCHKFNANEI